MVVIAPEEQRTPGLVVVTASTPPKPQAMQDAPAPVAEPVAAKKLVGNSKLADPGLIRHAVEVLLDTKSTSEEKQAVWNELREASKMDEAITALEARVAADPDSATDAAELGVAYLKNCGVVTDKRDQAIYAMQADKMFDTALALDPANWDARYNKAVDESYWPANMNKEPDVVQNFLTLIEQQEASRRNRSSPTLTSAWATNTRRRVKRPTRWPPGSAERRFSPTTANCSRDWRPRSERRFKRKNGRGEPLPFCDLKCVERSGQFATQTGQHGEKRRRPARGSCRRPEPKRIQ